MHGILQLTLGVFNNNYLPRVRPCSWLQKFCFPVAVSKFCPRFCQKCWKLCSSATHAYLINVVTRSIPERARNQMISGHKHVLRVCGLKMIWSQLKHAECCGETNEGWPLPSSTYNKTKCKMVGSIQINGLKWTMTKKIIFLISSSFCNGSSYSIYEIGDLSLTLIVLVATIRWRAPIRAKQRCPYLPSSHERLSCRVLLTVVLCSFHVVWSVPAVVILTIIYIFINFDWSRSFWSNVEPGWSHTVFAVVLYLNFELGSLSNRRSGLIRSTCYY